MEPTAIDSLKWLAKNFLEKLADEPKTKLQPKKEINQQQWMC